MKRRFTALVLTGTLLGWAGAVQADPVIYDNGGAFGTVGSGLLESLRRAEDFILPTNATGWLVTDVHWFGRDASADAPVTEFQINFYADDGGMPTGSGMTDPISTAIATRNVTPTQTGFPTQREYSVDIEPVELAGDTTYWMELRPLDASWNWIIANQDGGLSAAGSTSFWTLLDDREHIFSLTGTPGTPIPAPGAALLAMLGLPAVGWVKRRFN